MSSLRLMLQESVTDWISTVSAARNQFVNFLADYSMDFTDKNPVFTFPHFSRPMNHEHELTRKRA